MASPEPSPDSLATPTDLALFAVGALSSQDAQSLLDIASDDARQFAGWHISEHDYDVLLDSAGDRVLMLPAMQLTSVDSIEVRGVEVPAESYEWSTHGAVEARGRWPRGRRIIRAQFTAGYNPVPGDIIGAVCGLAARKASTRGGFTSQRIGSLSLSGQLRGGFEDPEGTLSRYKLP